MAGADANAVVKGASSSRNRSGRRRGLVVAGLVCLCVAAYWIGRGTTEEGGEATSQPRPPVIDGLAVDASTLDLGSIWEQEDFFCSLPISNVTAKPINVEGFDYSCGCLGVDPAVLTIGPGETTKVRVKLDLTWRLPREINVARRRFVTALTPLVKGASPPRTNPGHEGCASLSVAPHAGIRDIESARRWQLSATIKSRVTLDALSVHFGEELVQGEPPRERRLVATLHEPARAIEAAMGPPDLAQLRITRLPDVPRFEISVLPSTDSASGPFRADLRVGVISRDGERLAGTVIPVAGRLEPRIRAFPRQLLLGSHRVGKTATGMVSLHGVHASGVERVESDCPEIAVEPVPEPEAPGGATYQVGRRVTREGDQTGVVRFFLAEQHRALTPTLTIEVHCYGEALREAEK